MAEIGPLGEELLAGRYIAALGTLNASGTVHLSAVWYRWDGERLLVPTYTGSRKIKNVRERPTASLMVDTRTTAAMKGVSLAGPAEVVEGHDARRLNRSIHERYLAAEALADPQVGQVFAEDDDLTILIIPEQVATWDMTTTEGVEQVFHRNGYLLPLDP